MLKNILSKSEEDFQMLKKIVLLSCFLSMPLLGESLTGEYGVTGFNPHTKEPYRGTAHIEEKGDIYDITWHIKPKGPVYSGTGIRKGDTLSVVFSNPSNISDVGVGSYTIEGDTITGKWIFQGRSKKGSETFRRL